MLAQFAGALSANTCSMLTPGDVLICACLMAILHIAKIADWFAWAVSSCIQLIVEIAARHLGLESGVIYALRGKIGIILQVLETAFIVSISAAIICAMTRFLQTEGER